MYLTSSQYIDKKTTTRVITRYIQTYRQIIKYIVIENLYVIGSCDHTITNDMLAIYRMLLYRIYIPLLMMQIFLYYKYHTIVYYIYYIYIYIIIGCLRLLSLQFRVISLLKLLVTNGQYCPRVTYSIHTHILYIVPCTLHTVLCTLYTIHRTHNVGDGTAIARRYVTSECS